MRLTDIPPRTIRLPRIIWQKIAEEGEENCRSMNAQLLAHFAERYGLKFRVKVPTPPRMGGNLEVYDITIEPPPVAEPQ
jgi:hypothetical protein